MLRSAIPWVLLCVVSFLWLWQWGSGYVLPLSGQIVTTDNARELRDTVKNDTTLTDEQQAAFAKALGSDSGIQPYGKPVAQVISEQEKKTREDDSASFARALAAALVVDELKKDLEIRPSGFVVKRGTKTYGSMTMDESWLDVDVMQFSVTNRGKKAIRFFSADATVSNGHLDKFTERSPISSEFAKL